MKFIPRIQEAKDAFARMNALCEFIEYWIGPRQPDYGESNEALIGHSLPKPLQRLYEFAGKWPGLHPEHESLYTVGAFSFQDSLSSLSNLKCSDSGKIEFVFENQSCWQCRTLKEGDDPPVWCEGDWFDENGNCPEGEVKVCDSLSRFLVTFVLQELTYGSRLSLFDVGLQEKFTEERNQATPIWINGPYVYDADAEFYLWNDILVSGRYGDYYFGANHPSGIDFLKQNQGEVVEIGLIAGTCWDLKIQLDGSASVEYRSQSCNEKSNIPVGTFDFLKLVTEFEEQIDPSGSFGTNAILLLRRKGQRCTIGRPLNNRYAVKQLFASAIKSASPANFTLEKLLKQRWRYSV